MSGQEKKRKLSDIGPSTDQSDKPGETKPEAISRLILLPTKEELDRVLYLVFEKERYKKAIELADRELKELYKKPELANLARSYQAALSGRQKKPSSSPSIVKSKEKVENKTEGKEDKKEEKDILQLSPRPQTPSTKKTPSQKRREKEKKKKAAEKEKKAAERKETASKVENNPNSAPSSPFSNLSLQPLGSNHPMPSNTSSSSSSSSLSSFSSTSSSSMSSSSMK